MAFNIAVHKNILFQILKDIYSDTTISPFLGFKGGTAALMFYGLDRFSVDLDFDLLDVTKENYIFERIKEISIKHGEIKQTAEKRFSFIVVISYEEKSYNIKIEANKRLFGSRYELKSLLGISTLVMVREDMFANKLMAMYERIGKTGRDIYDVWFFLRNRWPINKTIIELRSGTTFENTIKKSVNKLKKMSNKNVLVGLGEFLTQKQKDWARAKLLEETIFFLEARLKSEE